MSHRLHLFKSKIHRATVTHADLLIIARRAIAAGGFDDPPNATVRVDEKRAGVLDAITGLAEAVLSPPQSRKLRLLSFADA